MRAEGSDQPWDPGQAIEAVDGFLGGDGGLGLPPLVAADLLVTKAIALANSDRSIEAIDVFDQVVERFHGDVEQAVAHIVAYALLRELEVLVVNRRGQDTPGCPQRLLEVFDRPHDRRHLIGIGMMVIDANFWLLAVDRVDNVLALSDVVISRLVGMDASAQTVVAGAHFSARA